MYGPNVGFIPVKTLFVLHWKYLYDDLYFFDRFCLSVILSIEFYQKLCEMKPSKYIIPFSWEEVKVGDRISYSNCHIDEFSKKSYEYYSYRVVWKSSKEDGILISDMWGMNQQTLYRSQRENKSIQIQSILHSWFIDRRPILWRLFSIY